MVNIGYARVSTIEQDTILQIKALKEFGCDIIYEDNQSHRRISLAKALA